MSCLPVAGELARPVGRAVPGGGWVRWQLEGRGKVHRPACKPGSVPPLTPSGAGTVTVIYLAGRLPGRSSDLPEGRNGPDQPCPLIWSCSRWGLPSQPVTRLLVGSYIKGPRSPHLFTLTSARCPWSVVRCQTEATLLLTTDNGQRARRYAFCCT